MAYKILNKTYLSDLFPAGGLGGGGFINYIFGTNPPASFVKLLSFSVLGLIFMLHCMSVCCGVLKGLSSHDCKGQIAQPLISSPPFFRFRCTAPATLVSSSCSMLAHTHPHSPPSLPVRDADESMLIRLFPTTWTISTLRITRSLRFGVVSSNWTVTLLCP